MEERASGKTREKSGILSFGARAMIVVENKGGRV
jgi:hypothetical protein